MTAVKHAVMHTVRIRDELRATANATVIARNGRAFSWTVTAPAARSTGTRSTDHGEPVPRGDASAMVMIAHAVMTMSAIAGGSSADETGIRHSTIGGRHTADAAMTNTSDLRARP